MRFDFVFSYWIFAWYLLYMGGATTYNPKIALIVGVIHNSIMLLTMIYYKNDWIHILSFCFINLCIKVIPLWTLRKDAYHWKDFYALVVYFILYIVWLYVNNKLQLSGIDKGVEQIKNNLPAGPFMQFVDKYLRS